MVRPLTEEPQPIDRIELSAEVLMSEHPPLITNANKRTVFDIACPQGALHVGNVGYSRWGAPGLPKDALVNVERAVSRTTPQPGFFDYASSADSPEAFEWHLNFAANELFVSYGGGAFAQDEMQVAEHPALAALREALIDRDFVATTIAREQGSPTPVLVTNVERRCSIATFPDPAEGRPMGLYGRAFSAADSATVQRATTRIEPPTMSNIIAIVAPAFGVGRYTDIQIAWILATAFTGFRAAVLETALVAPGAPVTIHTGFWGCGAFGGNHVLMTILQLIAAEMAHVDSIVFHTAEREGENAFAAGAMLLEYSLAKDAQEISVIDLIGNIDDLGFQWGVSNGT